MHLKYVGKTHVNGASYFMTKLENNEILLCSAQLLYTTQSKSMFCFENKMRYDGSFLSEIQKLVIIFKKFTERKKSPPYL